MCIGSLCSIDSESDASAEKVKKYDEPGAGKNPSRKNRRSEIPETLASVVAVGCLTGRDRRPPVGCFRAVVRSDARFFPPVLIDLSVRLWENPTTCSLQASTSPTMLQRSVVKVHN